MLGDGPATADAVASLELHRRTVQEAVRLYPPVAAIVRTVVRAVRVGPFELEPGDHVTVATMPMHRNPAFWPDPHAFDESRFAPGAIAARERFAYLPFGDGPRVCIGSGFALTEAALVLARLTPALRFAPAGGAASGAAAQRDAAAVERDATEGEPGRRPDGMSGGGDRVELPTATIPRRVKSEQVLSSMSDDRWCRERGVQTFHGEPNDASSRAEDQGGLSEIRTAALCDEVSFEHRRQNGARERRRGRGSRDRHRIDRAPAIGPSSRLPLRDHVDLFGSSLGRDTFSWISTKSTSRR